MRVFFPVTIINVRCTFKRVQASEFKQASSYKRVLRRGRAPPGVRTSVVLAGDPPRGFDLTRVRNFRAFRKLCEARFILWADGRRPDRVVYAR